MLGKICQKNMNCLYIIFFVQLLPWKLLGIYVSVYWIKTNHIRQSWRHTLSTKHMLFPHIQVSAQSGNTASNVMTGSTTAVSLEARDTHALPVLWLTLLQVEVIQKMLQNHLWGPSSIVSLRKQRVCWVFLGRSLWSPAPLIIPPPHQCIWNKAHGR